MPPNLRQATPQDIAACIEIRRRTRENALTAPRLAELGITEVSWSAEVREGQLLGFVAEDDAALVGYCFGHVPSGEIVVLALLPTYEGRGLGRQLLTVIVEQLKLHGHSRLDPRLLQRPFSSFLRLLSTTGLVAYRQAGPIWG